MTAAAVTTQRRALSSIGRGVAERNRLGPIASSASKAGGGGERQIRVAGPHRHIHCRPPELPRWEWRSRRRYAQAGDDGSCTRNTAERGKARDFGCCGLRMRRTPRGDDLHLRRRKKLDHAQIHDHEIFFCCASNQLPSGLQSPL